MTSPSGSSSSDRPLLAIFLRLAAMVVLSTMFMLVKLASERGVSLPELMFWRQAMAVLLLLGWLAPTGGLPLLATRRIGSHALRAGTGTAGLCCNLGAATLLALPEATTLGFTSPLFAVLATALVMRVKVGPWRWMAVVLGFAGVLIIAQPGSNPVPPLGLAAGLGAGVMVTIISFQIRDLARTEPAISCVFWFAFFGALIMAVGLPYYGRAHAPTEWLLLAGIGLTGTFAQILMTSALRFGQVATVMVMDYSMLVWATFYGWLVWGGFPSQATWIGAPLIIGAGMIVIWREHKLSRPVSPASSLDEGAIEEMRANERTPPRRGT